MSRKWTPGDRFALERLLHLVDEHARRPLRDYEQLLFSR